MDSLIQFLQHHKTYPHFTGEEAEAQTQLSKYTRGYMLVSDRVWLLIQVCLIPKSMLGSTLWPHDSTIVDLQVFPGQRTCMFESVTAHFSVKAPC